MALPDPVDLNLWRVFHQLVQDRQVSRAAVALGVTQPAVSNALARLRRALGDELFTRTPQGMLPTPRALALAEPVAQALALLGEAARPAARFLPAEADRGFCLAMTDIGEIVFLPALLAALAEEAPGVRLSTVRQAAATLQDDMAAGRVDLAIGLLPQLGAGFYQRRLFGQRYVCLFRQGHPLAGRRLTRSAFERAGHVEVVSAGTGHGQVAEGLRRQGIARQVRLTVPHFVAVGHILQHSDLLATVPERLAQQLAGPFGLAWAAHPARLPAFTVNLFWHARVHRDAANQWLRGRVAGLFGAGTGVGSS